jgi:hypothetical protein
MNEAEFTDELVKLLKAELTDQQVEARKSIFYSLYIDEQGNIPLNLNKQGEPIRGGGTGFEQDILLFERVAGQTSIAPRVVVEIKFGRVTTHDTIVYSEKAHKIRNVYPYLRYGLVLGGLKKIPPRVLRMGLGFDFMVRISNPPSQGEISGLIALLQNELDTSKKLGKIFSGAIGVSGFRRQVQIEPKFDLNPLASSKKI